MTTTSTRRLVALLAVLGLVTAGVAGVGAVSVAEEDVVEQEAVGETVTASVTLEELYRNPNYEEWSVAGETELQNVTWTVEYISQTGTEIRQVEVDGQSVNVSAVENPQQLRVDANADTPAAEVQVQVTGDVPPVEEYTYPPLAENGTGESFLVMQLTQDRGAGGTANTVDSWEAVHYTDQSREARNALDAARATIREANDAGLDVSDAEDDFASARAAYQEENFDLAVELATDAEDGAQSALDSRGIPTIVVAAAVVVVLVLAAVGVYLYRQRQEPDTKLR